MKLNGRHAGAMGKIMKGEEPFAVFEQWVDTAAQARRTPGVDGLKAAVAAIGQNCGNCHETFRKPL